MHRDRPAQLEVAGRGQERNTRHSLPKEARSDKWHFGLRRGALRIGAVVRCGIVLLCLGLAFAGCSSGPQAGVEQPSATVSATAEADRSGAEQQAGVEQPSATVSSTAEADRSGADNPSDGTEVGGQTGGWGDGEDWPRPPFAGMYAQHPEMMLPMEEFRGIVSIEPPCVYFYSEPEPESEEIGRERLVLSLPYPEVRFDEGTQTLWSGDIPISHGDRVLTGGGDGLNTVGGKEPDELHLFWDVCAAQGVGTVFGVESVEWFCTQEPPDWPSAEQSWQRICVEDTRPRNQRELLEQQGLAPVVEPPTQSRGPGESPPVVELPPPPLHGAFPYHPDMELELDKLVGILSIEPAPRNKDTERECVYLYPTAASAQQTVLWGDSWKHTGPEGQPLAVRLDLPYPQVRFDEDTWTLRSGDIGPMTTGTRVIVDPIAPPDFNDTGYDSPKQPHETLINVACDKANARATVLDIQPVEHYCTHDPPARHQSQCEQAMSLRDQAQSNLTLPE